MNRVAKLFRSRYGMACKAHDYIGNFARAANVVAARMLPAVSDSIYSSRSLVEYLRSMYVTNGERF